MYKNQKNTNYTCKVYLWGHETKSRDAFYSHGLERIILINIWPVNHVYSVTFF